MYATFRRLARRPSIYVLLAMVVALTLAGWTAAARATETPGTVAVAGPTAQTTPAPAPTAAAPTVPPPPPPPVTAPPKPTVALVGDSLLAMAMPQVEQEFADYDLSIDARPGWTIDMQLENAIEMAGDQPEAMIIVLGANDSSPEAFSRTGMERDVARLLDSIGTVPCIRWVTVQEDFYFDSLSAGSVGTLTLNVTLFREAAVRPNLEVVDFAPIINDQPEWHVMDLLHLDDRGSQAMAELMADSLDCLDERP